MGDEGLVTKRFMVLVHSLPSRTTHFLIFPHRVDYLEKSKHLQDQLRDLRSEIEVLKVGEKQSEFDLIHDEQVRMGENKYSTLKRVRKSILLISARFGDGPHRCTKIFDLQPLLYLYSTDTRLLVSSLKHAYKSPLCVYAIEIYVVCGQHSFQNTSVSPVQFVRGTLTTSTKP